MHEVQVDNILKKAKNLKSITEEPLAKKVLEIDLNATSSKNQDLLFRLIRSLDQFINKEQTLVYVGFVGHYSSGKSSTINSLLSLSSTVNERSTGLNPTDKAITLLTDIQNSNALILMNRESGNVPVRTSFINDTFLRNLVIADTPGSGDPQVVNEMIQDFLPICDYILYFISAANPVDQADLPLLIQKTQKLPFIPTFFVVTRTDEFRVNKSLTVEDKNINQSKKDQFLGQLISRIKELIKIEDIDISNFTFIDNEYSYGLNDLKNKLESWVTDIDKEGLLKIHGYKVEYYRTSLDTIYLFFTTTIADKIKLSSEFLKTANENILRFDKSIELNNEKLKLLWTKSESTFRQVLYDEKKSLDELKQDSIPTSIVNDKNILLERKLIIQSIESQATGYYGKITLDLNNHFKKRIREIKHSILENITKGDIMLENLSHLFPGRLDMEMQNQSLDIDFSKVNEHAKYYLNKVNEVLVDVKNSLKSKTYNYKTITTKEALIKSINQLYKQGDTIINENFDQYFERIQMYRSTVLTRNTKETIEKLRIGTQLDELDDEFSDDFMKNMKNKAISEVYFANNDNINELQKLIEKSNSNILDIKTAIDKLSISNELTHQPLGKENIEISQLTNDLVRKGEEIINKDYQNRLHKVLDIHKTKYQNYLVSISLIKKTRNTNILKWSLIVGAIFICIYLGLKFYNIISPSTVLSDIIIGLCCTAVGNIIGFVYAMFKNDVKKLTTQSREQFIKAEKSELLQLFNEDFWDELSKKVTEPRTDINFSFLKAAINKKCDPILTDINSNKQSALDGLCNLNNKLVIEINNYLEKIESFHNIHSVIFQEPEKNIEKIGLITKHIKETAIKPSFDLLKETTENLVNVKTQIEKNN